MYCNLTHLIYMKYLNMWRVLNNPWLFIGSSMPWKKRKLQDKRRIFLAVSSHKTRKSLLVKMHANTYSYCTIHGHISLVMPLSKFRKCSKFLLNRTTFTGPHYTCIFRTRKIQETYANEKKTVLPFVWTYKRYLLRFDRTISVHWLQALRIYTHN